MNIINTPLQDVFIIEPNVIKDDRGYFMEAFKEEWFKDKLKNKRFVQDNESKSSYGVLRGLHFQKPPFEQAKLIRVVQGKILDVIVDLRRNFLTFGEHQTFILSSENKRQLFIPKGFAHGFVTLSNEAVIHYKVDEVYSPLHESGILWNDTSLQIDWQMNLNDIKLSVKDKNLPEFRAFVSHKLN